MKIPTLVVSNPPHGPVDEMDLETAAELLGLDIFATRVKAEFGAPEILGAADHDAAETLAAGLSEAGLRVVVMEGTEIARVPWADVAQQLIFDDEVLRLGIEVGTLEVGYDTPAVAVACRPPSDAVARGGIDPYAGIASGHPPTVAEGLQSIGFIDLYFHRNGALRRVAIAPALLGPLDRDITSELTRRFSSLRIDRRLQGVWPRTSFAARGGSGHTEGPKRRGYAFGTPRLADLLGDIDPVLRTVPQFELGSRLAYALDPLRSEA